MTNLFRQWREAMGYKSQKDAGDALGYSAARVKQWESGDERHQVPYATRLAMNALYHRLMPWE